MMSVIVKTPLVICQSDDVILVTKKKITTLFFNSSSSENMHLTNMYKLLNFCYVDYIAAVGIHGYWLWSA